MSLPFRFLLSCWSICVVTALQAQNLPAIVVCDDDTQTFCLESNQFELCAEIVLDDTFTEPIDFYAIIWGDGDTTFVQGDDPNLSRFKTYQFDFFGTCQYAEEIPVRLLIFLDNGDQLNNSFFLLFKNPPQAIINFTPGQPCVGTPVEFSATPCPSENFEVLSWEYGDGTSDNTGVHTYDQPGSFTVTLTVANDCETVSGQQVITVIEPAIAMASVIDGVQNSSEPFVVCSSTVLLDGSNSLNETIYDWSVQPGGNNTSWGNSTPDTVNPQIFFNEEDNYIVILEVDNACQIPDRDTLEFQVVGTDALSLQEEPDACQSLDYTPIPLLDEAVYTVDGQVIDAMSFPLTLGPGEHVIEAMLSSVCGDQSVVDSCTVNTLQQVAFQLEDTVLCSSSSPLTLAVNFPDAGECYLNGMLLPDCQFDPADALADNLIVFQGDCLESDSLRIEVIATDNLSISLPQNQFCISDAAITIATSNPGGQWSGKGFADPSSNLYDPSLAGVGQDTIQYRFNFVTPGDSCPAVVSQVVDIFPELFGDFIVTDCIGNTLSFDTISTAPSFTNVTYDFGDGNSSNQIAPSHTYASAGTYTVTLTISQTGGCSAQQSKMVTVEPPPIAAFSLAQADTVCSGTLVSFIDEAIGDDLNYVWLLNGDTLSQSATPASIELLALGQDSTYVLTQHVRNGCAADTAIRTIEVLAGPNPVFFVSQNTICSGDTLAINNVSANNGTFWLWDFGDGTIATGPIPPSHFFISEVQDTFEVQLTVGNTCDTMTYTETIIVVPTDVTAFLNIEYPMVCSGEPFRLVNGSGVPGAEFFFSDGNTAFGDTVFYQFNTEIDSTFEVTMRVYGCGFDEITRTIDVRAAPTLVVAVDEQTCNNESATFTLTSNVANLLLFYGDGDSSNLTLSTHLYDQVGTYQWIAQAISTDGCVTEQTGSLDVLEIGTADFSIENPLCENAVLNYVDASSGSIEQWLWDFGDGNQTSGNQAINHQYEMADLYTVQLITIFNNQCRDTTQQDIDVFAQPTADFSYVQSAPCTNNYDFTNLSSPSDFLEWDFGDGNTTTISNPNHTFNTTGSIPVRLIVSRNACQDTTTQIIEVPIFPDFAAELQFTTSACIPSTVAFTGNVSNADNILWDFGDGIQSNEANPFHTYVVANDYVVQLTVTGNGCEKDTTIAIT
ncbi:MAG: PKD domain-containing protein, partial [Bacteroidota bacterium]